MEVIGYESRLVVGGNRIDDPAGTEGRGELVIASGGTVSVVGPDAVTSIATDRGNSGLIRVEPGATLNAGRLLLVGEGWDRGTDSATGNGGEAALDIAGGTVTAERTVVAAHSFIDADGTLIGDL